MKKILFMLLCFPLLTVAQTTTKVTVHFCKPLSDSCSLKVPQYYIDEFDATNISIIKDNNCSFSVKLDKTTIGKFSYNNQSMWLYLEPGVDISLNFTKDTIYNSCSFSGKVAGENLFLRDFYEKFYKDLDKNMVKQTILNTSVDNFEINLYNEHKAQLDFYNAYQDKDKMNEMFRKYMETTIRYNYYLGLLSFPIINANSSKAILTVNALPAVMLESIDSKLITDEALSSETYRDFLFYYVVYFTSKANGFNKFKDFSTSMESKIKVAQQELNGKSLVWYIANFLSTDCNNVSPYTAGHIYGILSEKENNSTYTQLLKKKCEARMNAKEVAVKGSDNKSGNANTPKYPKLKDLDGKYFTLDDFKGKVVYIDFWASWCGPCRAKMPYSKKLHEMFDSKQLKNLVFLYISIDGDEAAWKAAVKQIGMEGKLGISPGNWSSEIASFFQINSIPRYMLMDKNGKIVDLNAKRPSTGQALYEEISKLLYE